MGTSSDRTAEVVLGSDAPVAPLDPWDGIASAVHGSLDGRDPWAPGAAAGPRRRAGRRGLLDPPQPGAGLGDTAVVGRPLLATGRSGARS
jgi:hypothetical protein